MLPMLTIGMLTWSLPSCQAQLPFIPKDLSDEPYSQAWTYLPNMGQVFDVRGNFRDAVMFHSVGTMPTLYMYRDSRTSITFPDTLPEDTTLDRLVRLDMWLEAAHGNIPVLIDEVPRRYNFYEQYTPEGVTDVTGGKRVCFENVYDNVDYHIFSNARGPKFLLVIRPGGDPDQVVFRFAGQDSLNVDLYGFLKLHANNKEMIFPQGMVYQQQGQTVIPVPWIPHYDMQGPATVRLQLGAYDPELPLMILIQPLGGMGGGEGGAAVPPEWSTYMAGSGYDDAITDLTHDNEENLYFTGYSRSTSGLPIDVGVSPAPAGGYDVIVGRVNPNYEIETPDTWMTYFGGEDDDRGNGIVYDVVNNRLAVCGGSDSPFNTLAFQGSYASPSLGFGFLALFDLSGHRTYATRMSLDYDITPTDLDVDEEGKTYVVGYGSLSNFQIVNLPGNTDYTCAQAAQEPGWLGHDAFVRQFSPDMEVAWSTALGGPVDDQAHACTIDPVTKRLYVVGVTNTPNDLDQGDCPACGWYDFPLCNSAGGYYQDLLNGWANSNYNGEDAFVTAFSTDTKEMVWSTYLGSPAGAEGATDVAVDGKGNVYITGYTNMGSCSNTCDWWPNGFSGCENGQYFNGSPNGYWTHHFLYRFDRYLEMTWGTFIGGGQQGYFGNRGRTRLACDRLDNVYIFGSSNSGAFPPDAPVLPPMVDPSMYNQGGHADAPQPDDPNMPFDAYIGGFDALGQLFYSSYFGGYGNDYAGALEIVGERVYIGGCTAAATLFPTHAPDLPGHMPYLNPLPSASTTDVDAFLAQLRYTLPVSVEEPKGEQPGVLIFPNPTTNDLELRFHSSGFTAIEVVNIMGQVILREPIVGTSMLVHVGSLAKGTYVVRATGPGISAVSRFIKQ